MLRAEVRVSYFGTTQVRWLRYVRSRGPSAEVLLRSSRAVSIWPTSTSRRACRDLLDAARIDGAAEFRAFWRIAMPLATPVIAFVGFLMSTR
jgi:hypothetical protein